MEVKVEVTTVVKVSVVITTFKETTSKVIALGETAFVKVDLIKSTTYTTIRKARILVNKAHP